MPFETFVHYVHPLPPPPPPPPKKKKEKEKKRFFFLSICKKQFTNTESSWQIIQIRKKIVGVGGGVCGLGELGVGGSG